MRTAVRTADRQLPPNWQGVQQAESVMLMPMAGKPLPTASICEGAIILELQQGGSCAY